MKISRFHFLRSLFLSAGLGITPLYAQDEPLNVPAEKDTAIQIFGTDETLQALQPFAEAFKEMAEQDVLVVSPGDLLTPHERKIAMVMERLSIPKEDFIDFGAALKKMRILTDPHLSLEPTFEYPFFTSLWAEMIINHSPFSSQDPKTDVCLIGGADSEMDARRLATRLANLPPDYMLALNLTITAEELYKFVMLHEARHCAQPYQQNEDPIIAKVEGLGNEIDADYAALEAMREDYADRPEHFEKIKSDIKALRTLGLIRGGHALSKGVGGFATHGGVFSNHDDVPPDPAEIIAATGMLNMNNLVVGAIMPMFLQASKDPIIQMHFKNKEFLLPTSPEDEGKFILDHYPDLEYAMFRALSAVLRKYEADDKLTQTPLLGSAMGLMDDYIAAFEHLVPTIKDDPIAGLFEESLEEGVKTQLEKIDDLPALSERPPAQLPPQNDFIAMLRYAQEMREELDREEMERLWEEIELQENFPEMRPPEWMEQTPPVSPAPSP